MQRPMVQGLILAVAVLIVYGNSLQVPWYFDDFRGICQNPTVRDLDQALQTLFAPRGVVDFTFALNYRYGELDVFGYHAVNIVIHLLAGLTVWRILRRIFPPPSSLAVAGALIFLLHPLQTQTVTYIIQRYASFSGLGFFLSLLFFIRAREALQQGERTLSLRHGSNVLLSLLFAAMAVLSKQNAVVLPLAMVLFDRYFLPIEKDRSKSLLWFLLPLVLAGAWMGWRQILSPLLQGASWFELTGIENSFQTADRSPLLYLVTEFSVLWIYVRKLFLPFGLTLDYGYPMAKVVFSWQSVVAFAGHVALIAAAITFRHRVRLVSFGIFWFYLALAVESSVIPLDPMFDHRLYVPLFGFVVVLLGLVQRLPQPKTQLALLLGMLTVFATLSGQRNALWAEPLAFYEDNLRKAPSNSRIYDAVSKQYFQADRLPEAIAMLERATEARPNNAKLYANLGLAYQQTGDVQQALDYHQQAYRLDPADVINLNGLGGLFLHLNRPEDALIYLQKALKLRPSFEEALTNQGMAYAQLGQTTKAQASFQQALVERPRFALAHYNLGALFYQQGHLIEARESLLRAVELEGRNPDYLFVCALISFAMNDQSGAQQMLGRLQQVDRRRAMELQRLMVSGKR